MVASHELGMAPAMLVAPSRPTTTHDSTGRLVDVGYNCVVPRLEPAPPVPGANAVINGLLARVMRRRPDILDAFGRLDAAIRFHGQLPGSLKEAVRRATAAVLFALAGLHVLWGRGSSLPFSDPDELADAVIGRRSVPSGWRTRSCPHA